MNRVRFAIPKGHLAKETLQILRRAGYEISGGEDTYRPAINDPKIELKVLRPQEIPIYVQDGSHDVGITGRDWLRETRVDVEVLLDLESSRVQLALCVPKPWGDVDSLSDLLEKFSESDEILRISTEYLNLASDYLRNNSVYRRLYGDAEPLAITPWGKRGENDRVAVYLSFGATEAKPPENADAIIDVVETGRSIERNNLKMVETVMTSSAVLIANKAALGHAAKREKVYDILTLLKGVVDGRKRLHIFVNVSRGRLQELLRSLPALKSPTIAPLSEKGWCSVNTVIEKDRFLEVLPLLRKLAQGLVVYEPRQVLPLDEITPRVNEFERFSGRTRNAEGNHGEAERDGGDA